jgi:hypothetical protein
MQVGGHGPNAYHDVLFCHLLRFLAVVSLLSSSCYYFVAVTAFSSLIPLLYNYLSKASTL